MVPCRPGPLKCFGASHHQILAISAPQEARNHDKTEFAAKMSKSSDFDLNPKNLKGAHLSHILCLKRAHVLQILK